VSRGTLDITWLGSHTFTGLSPSMVALPSSILLRLLCTYVIPQPRWNCFRGLGSFHFARRYFGNRFFFLFLRVLRCFSSPGSLYNTMYSCYSNRGSLCWVSPFGHLWIKVRLQLPIAFRSFPRPSSASGAKAFPLRPS
jgi:hypothetical protein